MGIALLTTEQVAAQLQVHSRTLKRWRDSNRGPAFLLPDGTSTVRYRVSDIEAWLALAAAQPRVAKEGEK